MRNGPMVPRLDDASPRIIPITIAEGARLDDLRSRVAPLTRSEAGDMYDLWEREIMYGRDHARPDDFDGLVTVVRRGDA